MKRIEQAWNSFEAAVVPKEAGPGQRQSMKMAFYGGASIMFAEISKIAGPGSEVTAAEVGSLEQLGREVMEFAMPPLPSGAVN